MKNILVVTLALVAIIGISYWSFDILRQRTFIGENLFFEVGNGYDISLTNPSDRPVPVEMRAAGQTPFRITIPALDLNASSSLQGSRPDLYESVAFNLPPGQVTIHVKRGSDIWFVSDSDAALHAVVTPLSVEDVQFTITFAGSIILIALYFISSTMQHRWVGMLRDRGVAHTRSTSAASQDHSSVTS